ncbi:MAG: hypothetical protein ACP5OG_03930 [Candidatus Nanoarchaeia archaeon]
MVLSTKVLKKISRREVEEALLDLGLEVIRDPFLLNEASTATMVLPKKQESKLYDRSINKYKAGIRAQEITPEMYSLQMPQEDYSSDEEIRELRVTSPIINESLVNLPKRSLESDIEEILKEKWRYLVMQLGGVFLTEVRPNKCFIGNKTLADKLILQDNKKGYSLDTSLLKNYLDSNSKGFIQVHFSDIMFNPKLDDYDIFSISSGNINKANIYLDLAKFLHEYNKGKETIIPVHVPYFEKWKTSNNVVEFGLLSDDGKRDAIFNSDKVLRYLVNEFEKNKLNVKLALETGNGPVSKNGAVNYALIYEPHFFKTLIQGREKYVSICEDVGHLNLVNQDWKEYLIDEISEFHVSGNDGKSDLHTLATPKTLAYYDEITSFLKFYPGNICAEIGRGNLTNDEFVNGVKNLAYTLFSTPEDKDYKMLESIKKQIKDKYKSKIFEKNLSEKM